MTGWTRIFRRPMRWIAEQRLAFASGEVIPFGSREARASRSHPNVINVYNTLPLTGGPVIPMELLGGQSAARDRQRTRASVPRAVDSGEVAVALCATVRPCRWCARLG